MHIGFLTPEYPHPKSSRSGGIGTSIKNLVEPLADKGITISVFIYDQAEDLHIELADISLYFIKKRKFVFFGGYFHRKYLQKYLNTQIVQKKIDLIEAPDWTGITAFMNFKCPLVLRIHGSDTYFCHLEQRIQKKKNFLLEKKAIRCADHIISVSHYAAKISKELFKIENYPHVIPNAINLNDFIPEPQLAVPERILYFGSVIRKKGVLELAEIFNKVIEKNQQARLVIAGNDVIDHITNRSTWDMIKENLTLKANSNTEWLGNLEYTKIILEIKKANVVILPSFAEALPMTWLEAMALEKAMVTSDIGWSSEIMIDNETGFVTHPKNHSEYSNKILFLLENQKVAKKMGKRARERVSEKFSSQKVPECKKHYLQKK